MITQIIAERDNTLILYMGGKVKTVPNTIYNQLKFRDFKGERISYKFNDDMHVQETFDDGIFNAFIKEETVQIRDGVSLCVSIKEHKETNSNELFDTLFKKIYFKSKKNEIMQQMLSVFGERVQTKTTDKETRYIIDDRFMVNDKGVSHYLSDKGNEWKFLCTVAQGNLGTMSITTDIGEIQLESTELTIMGKVGYLLAPNIQDNVFFHQLGGKLQDVLKAEVEFDTRVLEGMK